MDDLVFSCFKKKIRAFLDDYTVKHDNLNIKEENLVEKAINIFNGMKSSIFKKSWINTCLLKSEEFDEIEDGDFDDLDVAGDVLDKAEEEEMVERFLALEIEEGAAKNQTGIPMDVQQEPEVESTDKTEAEKPSTSKWPQKQSKITSFFK